jgi:hypothetical protein
VVCTRRTFSAVVVPLHTASNVVRSVQSVIVSDGDVRDASGGVTDVRDQI